VTYPKPEPSTFERARRRRAYRALARLVRRRESGSGLLPLEEVSRRLRAFEQTYLGFQPIPVDRIVGTVSRNGEFDREFLPQREEVRDRWRRVEQSFPEGDFPPIEVYQVGEAYFVVDGHHRVAVARQRGVSHIDAEVTLLRSRWKLPADADLGRIIMAEQERLFMEESGLERSRPDARIGFTRPQGYRELLENIKVHGYHLMQEGGEVQRPEEVAADWYDNVYLPGVEAVRSEGLSEEFPGATEADLFLWVDTRRRELFPERGNLGYADAARVAREEPGPRGRGGNRRRTPEG
jgi:hypothetical protein